MPHVRFSLDLMPIGRDDEKEKIDWGSRKEGKMEHGGLSELIRCEWVTMTLESGDMNE